MKDMKEIRKRLYNRYWMRWRRKRKRQGLHTHITPEASERIEKQVNAELKEMRMREELFKEETLERAKKILREENIEEEKMPDPSLAEGASEEDFWSKDVIDLLHQIHGSEADDTLKRHAKKVGAVEVCRKCGKKAGECECL